MVSSPPLEILSKLDWASLSETTKIVYQMNNSFPFSFLLNSSHSPPQFLDFLTELNMLLVCFERKQSEGGREKGEAEKGIKINGQTNEDDNNN